MKIRETQVGQTVAMNLLVKSAEIKKTKADKPYLYMVLSDGTDELQGQDWDFGNGTPPAKNAILEVYGQIGEFMGKKQIKISTFKPSELGVDAFAPRGNFDINKYIVTANELRSLINNPYARDIVDRAFKENGELWKTIPSARGVHHAFIAGNLQHTVDVTLKARAIASLIPEANMDLVTAGALVHDLGKLWTYILDGAIIDMSDQGQMLEHIVIGIKKTEAYRTPENSAVLDLIQHIQSSHHGLLEYGSPTTPRFLEAWIVNYADGIDAKAQTIREAEAKVSPDAKFTDKIWVMDNRPMFTRNFIYEVMQ